MFLSVLNLLKPFSNRNINRCGYNVYTLLRSLFESWCAAESNTQINAIGNTVIPEIYPSAQLKANVNRAQSSGITISHHTPIAPGINIAGVTSTRYQD